jgi:hypothetical protein
MNKPLEEMTAPSVDASLQVSYDKRMMVAAGRASKELGDRIAERLGVTLTDAGLKTFSDGEVYCRYEESQTSSSSSPSAAPSARASP